MEHFDVVIVGAGLHGLAMARTLVDAVSNNPKRIVILDENRSIGGTWAAERLYPGLKTNNVVGSYEFSDFPMDLKRYGLKPGQHIPGLVVHEYFTDFAKYFGLDKLFRPQTKVEAASLLENGTWRLDCIYLGKDGPKTRQLTCDKLVIATGLTSEARMPTFPGSANFLGPLFHAKDLHRRSHELKGCQEVVVVGGNKSAWDVCYSVASRGARAHMVIRQSGGGPSWVWRQFSIFGVRLTLARLSSTRLFSWFDPSPFGSSFSSVRRFLHGTIIGSWLIWAFWTALDYFAAAATGYSDPRLRMLRPWTSTFWMGNSLSIHNYEIDWFELVRKGRIVVHHADVTTMGEKMVQLSDGSIVDADAVVSCTGWKCAPPIRFYPEGISEELGLPCEANSITQTPNNSLREVEAKRTGNMGPQSRHDDEVRSKARAEIKRQCSQLGFSPKRTLPSKDSEIQTKWTSFPRLHSNTPLLLDSTETPYHLYRFLVPCSPKFLHLRNIAFIGMHRSIHAVIVAQAQALWITAFFFSSNHPQTILDAETVSRETISHVEYERLRRPKESGGSGASFPDLVFDSIPYTDLLLEDLGLKTMRKRTLWAEIARPYLPADYRGLIDEWRAKTTHNNARVF
ncbi:FAD/NAD(P)-binding domain-containing protein [Nemania sp. FL0916]|nr:FAD/NAD(P)-binding domain-containing protein [Nemania sp. FL0916]